MGVIIGEYGDRASTADLMERMADMAVIGLSALTAGADDIAGRVQTAADGLANEAAETTPDLEILAGYLQVIIQSPALVTVAKLDDRFDSYAALATDFATLLDDLSTDSVGFNRALAVELGMSSIINGLSVIITTGQPDTRSHAITLADQLLTIFETIVQELDEAQELFETRPFNSRYFSQTSTYSIASNLVATDVRYLLTSAYNLKIEKKFTLREPTAPVMLAIREYPGVAIDDAFDLLIKANSLSNIEILLLDAGREVVVYI
jgi:hypothetical protein